MKKIFLNSIVGFVMATNAMASQSSSESVWETAVVNNSEPASAKYLRDEGVLELFDPEQNTGSLFIFLDLISTADCKDLTECLKQSGIWDRCKEDQGGAGLYKLYGMLAGSRQFNKDKAVKIGDWIKALPVMKTASFGALRDLFLQFMDADFPSILEAENIGSMYVEENKGANNCYEGYSPNEPWIVFYTALLDSDKPNSTIKNIVDKLVTKGRPMDRINTLHRIFQFNGLKSSLAQSFLNKLGLSGSDLGDIEEFYSQLYVKFGGFKFASDGSKYVYLSN